MKQFISFCFVIALLGLTACSDKAEDDHTVMNTQPGPSELEISAALRPWETYIKHRSESPIYENALGSEADMKGWQLEGPAQLQFKDQWMHMWSPEEEYHHVYWCPEIFPDAFMAQWELQNMEDYGLCIIFFAARSRDGKNVLDPSLPPRDGTFQQYIVGALNNYHISYYAHTKNLPKRPTAHLRKNHGFHLVSQGPEAIPWDSTEIHTITLIKNKNHILLFVDDRKIIDFIDDGSTGGAAHTDGQLGFRQMQWSHFRYRNFKVWSLNDQ